MNLQQWQNSQANPEVVVNENFAVLDAYAVYSRNPQTSSLLVWGYYGGRWGGFSVPAGTLTLSANATNYVVVQRSNGQISVSTTVTNWNDQNAYGRVYRIVTSTNTVSSFEDHRIGTGGIMSSVSVSGAVGVKEVVNFNAASLTLQPQDMNKYIRFTTNGAKTVNINEGVNYGDNNEVDLSNRSSSGDLTIVPSAGFTLFSPKGGSPVLEPGDKITLKIISSNIADIYGTTKAFVAPPPPPPPVGGDPFFTNVEYLINFDTTPIQNSSSHNVPVEPFDNPEIVLFGGQSVAEFTSPFGSGWKTVRLLDNSRESLYIGSGDFTLELFLSPDFLPDSINGRNYILHKANFDPEQIEYSLMYDDMGTYFRISPGLDISTGPMLVGTMNHIAITRTGDTVRMFLNGVLANSFNEGPFTPSYNGNSVVIGYSFNSGAPGFVGKMQSIRFTKGVSRYTSNFTVPTNRYFPIS